MTSTPMWIPIVVAFLGVTGTILGVVLTQRQANRREERTWERQREQDENGHRREVATEQRTWLREQRFKVYGDLVRESLHFAASIGPHISIEKRVDAPDSELCKSRARYFELLSQAAFLADKQLQVTIRKAEDIAENIGHRPYSNDREKSEFHSQIHRDAFGISRLLEDCAREELQLPARDRTKVG